MRTFIFLLCTTVFGFNTERSFSQEKINIDHDQVITVDQVFKTIKSLTDYRFIYPKNVFKDAPQVQLKKGEILITDLLDLTLSSSNLKFTLTNTNTIVIDKKNVSDHPFQQQILTGKVTDSNKLPLVGVTIVINTNERGTTTDIDGNFNIRIAKGDKISFSYIGFETQEFVFNNQNELNIVLKEDTAQLEEVIISTGYQKISKERATGSYSTIAKAQLEKPASSIAERLVGQVAGVQSTTDANGNIKFEIRGQSSLFAAVEPLIVLDGFPIEGGFETINPNNVESITVLKDAAAASIWGAKSANGVIVITSKKAAQGKINVTFSSFVKVSPKLDLDYVLGRASSAEILAYEQRAFDSNFFDGLIGSPPSIGRSHLRPFSQAITAMNEARLGRITTSERDAKLAELSSINNTDQIEDYLLAAPLTKQYNVSISGGSEKMTNSLSLLYEDSNSFFQGDKKYEYLINYNTQVKLAKPLRFDLGAMTQYNDFTNNSVGLSTIRSLAPWDMLKNADGTLTDMSYLNYYMPNFDAFIPKQSFPYADWSYNPIQELNNREFNTKSINARIQAGLTLDIMKGLYISSRIQYELFNTQRKNYYSENTFDVRQAINESSSNEWMTGGIPTQLIPSGGVLSQSKSTLTAYNFRNQLNFERVFAKIHRVNFVAGSEISDRVFESTNHPNAFGYNQETLSSSPLLGDYTTAIDWNGRRISSAGPFNLREQHFFSENTIRLFSMYANVAYTYDDKYTISGSYRTDASNVISDDPKYRYNPFWSVGFGWQIDKENFIQNTLWLDRLNIRGTYGVNGNIDRSTSFKPLINLGSSVDLITGENTATISSFGNPTLRWEQTFSTNIGLDFSILNRLLFGALDVYNKKGTDLIVDQSISAVNGTTSQKFNNGEMVNKGFEITLGTSLPFKGNDIVWSGALNYAYNKNEITSFFKSSYSTPDLYRGPTTSYVEGNNANALWSYVYAGLMNVGSETNPILVPSVQGDNGAQSPITTWAPGEALNFMENQGTTVAPTTLGMRNSFKVYNFDLSFILTAKFGHVFRRQSFNYPAVTGGNTNVNAAYADVAYADANDRIPIPDSQPRYYFYDRFYPYMSYLTEDAGHIRIQEINLNYALPSKITDKLGVNYFNIFAQFNNVGTILFNDFGEDPEFTRGSIKPQTSLTFGIQLNF